MAHRFTSPLLFLQMNLAKYKSTLRESLNTGEPDQVLQDLVNRVNSSVPLFNSISTIFAKLNRTKKLYRDGQILAPELNSELTRIDTLVRDVIDQLAQTDLVTAAGVFDPTEGIEEQPDSVFISTPIASLPETEYRKMKKIVQEVQEVLRYDLDVTIIYYAGDTISGTEDFHSPEAAIKQDFRAIHACEYFLLIYPERIASSVLVEVGYAMCLKKKCLIYTKSRNDLPFLIRTADKVFKRVSIVEYADSNDITVLLKQSGLPF